MKIRAGALVYAIFIAFILFGLCSSFILFSYHHRKLVGSNETQLSYLIALNSAIELGLSKYFQHNDEEKSVVQLFVENTGFSISLKKESWGLYDILTAEHLNPTIYKSKTALIGSSAFEHSSLALYLTDKTSPLSMGGRTNLKGLCFLPKSGLRKAYIEGQNFCGVMPEPSEIRDSQKRLPSPNMKKITQLQKLFADKGLLDSVIPFESNIGAVVLNDWNGKSVTLQSSNEINLQTMRLKGKILVYSPSRITIENCELDGVIFISPIIIVKRQSKGNFQAIASDSILIDYQSRLNFPGSLSLINFDNSPDKKGVVSFKNQSYLEGDVLIHTSQTGHNIKLLLEIDASSGMSGRAYVKGPVELKGIIRGGLFCEEFILKTPSSMYSNHLFNSTIDRASLPTNFIGSSLFSTSNDIIKWLN